MSTLDAAGVPQTRVSWRPSYRLIPSRFPTVGLYDAVADPADLDAVYAIEAIGNPRLRAEAGELNLVPPEDRISGPGTTPVMAAFTHLNPEGSRFSNGLWGVYYAAHSLETSVAEVSHHRAVFLSRTKEAALDLDHALVTANVEATLHDLRDRPTLRDAGARAAVLDPDDYGPGQRLGRLLREAGSWGLVYPSVRDAGGECVAAFKPKALRHAKSTRHIALHWDGARISHWFEKATPKKLAR